MERSVPLRELNPGPHFLERLWVRVPTLTTLNRSHSRKGIMRDPSFRSSGCSPKRGGEGRREASGSGTGKEVSTGARDCTPQRNGNVPMCPGNRGVPGVPHVGS